MAHQVSGTQPQPDACPVCGHALRGVPVCRAVPGASLPVSHDPADPMRKVAIDWSAS